MKKNAIIGVIAFILEVHDGMNPRMCKGTFLRLRNFGVFNGVIVVPEDDLVSAVFLAFV